MRKLFIIWFVTSTSFLGLFAQKKELKLTVDNIPRNFRLTIPGTYTGNTPVPLVLILHGYDNVVKNMGAYTGLDQLAEKEDFIAAYPEGTRNSNGYYTWNAGSIYKEWTNNANDVKFIDSLIKHLCLSYSIDTSRIYVVGHDNGAMMAYRIATELSDKITAVACVAGQMVDNKSAPGKPVAVLHIHGDNDLVIPHTGTEQYGFQIPPIDEVIKKWLEWDKCSTVPSVLKYDPKVTALLWKGKADVRLYLLHNWGHDWPTAARGSWPASEFIWDFFKDLRK